MAAPFVYVSSLPTEAYRNAPILPRAPPPPMFIPLVDTPLPVKILQQIEYYFRYFNFIKLYIIYYNCSILNIILCSLT